MTVQVRTVKSSRSKTYERLMDYFDLKNIEVVKTEKPKEIQLEIGSYFDTSMENIKGNVTIKLDKKTSKQTDVSFRFDFSNNYKITFASVFLFFSVIGALMDLFGNTGMSSLRFSSLTGLFLGLVVFFISNSTGAPTTKNNFMEGTDKFLRKI